MTAGLLAAASLLVLLLIFAVALTIFITRDGTQTDASVRAADFAKSEEGRRTAEARASQTADALAVAEKARQEAGAKAADATAALTKTAENWRAAEARANDAVDAVKKSDKARLDAEARATGAAAAQAKAEEAQRAAEKARAAAEGAASGAAFARAQADNSRQLAEVRANDAVEALKKSEKARQEAEAKLAALTKISEGPVTNNYRVPREPPSFLLGYISGRGRWTTSGTASCANRDGSYYSAVLAGGAITWTSGSGNVDVEGIVSSEKDQLLTTTLTSRHMPSETNYKLGTSWTYWRDGNQVRVQNNLGLTFTLEPCP
jgi:hypothetical protein